MPLKLLKRILALAWYLPGFLLWAAFPPMAEFTDVLFALAPLLVLAHTGSVRESARKWFLNGLIFWFATLSWMPAIVKNGGPWPLVVLGWGALAAYCALFFGAFGWLSASFWRWISPRKSQLWRFVGILVVEPILWCGLELLRSRLFGGFAWNQLGVVAVNAGFGAPVAVGGVYLCSAAILLVNSSIAGIAERIFAAFRRNPEANKRKPLETIVIFAVIFAIYLLSNRLACPPSAPASEHQLRVALVQRNFPCCFKGETEPTAEIYTNICANLSFLTPELVVLPESAYAEVAPLDSLNARYFSKWLGRYCNSRYVLAGGGRRTENAEYNSAALYDNSTNAVETVQIYDKVHLVPFGEFIPGDKLIPVLQRLAPVGSCSSGELKTLKMTTANGETIELGVAICFEDTDSAQIRRLADLGAQALVFITNDSWFSDSEEAIQHAWQAVARSMETNLPVIRVGNSGVSGVILPDGGAEWLCDGDGGRPAVDKRGVMLSCLKIGSGKYRTVYRRFGDIPLFCAFLLLITLMIVIKYKYCYEKRRTLSLQVG